MIKALGRQLEKIDTRAIEEVFQSSKRAELLAGLRKFRLIFIVIAIMLFGARLLSFTFVFAQCSPIDTHAISSEQGPLCIVARTVKDALRPLSVWAVICFIVLDILIKVILALGMLKESQGNSFETLGQQGRADGEPG